VIPAVLAAYQMLQVAPWATREEIQRAYRAKAREHHPDLRGRDLLRPEEMVRLNLARELVAVR
jgi:DnaJ-class molecular chaperone